MIKVCLVCNEKLKKNSKTYCSHACHEAHKQEVFLKDWFAGKDIKTTKGNCVSNRIRKYLYILHESKCSICSWNKVNLVTGNIPLEVEHINGDSFDNRPENLTLLCPNCHSLTSTYRALNVGKGRQIRRQRYKEGKSY